MKTLNSAQRISPKDYQQSSEITDKLVKAINCYQNTESETINIIHLASQLIDNKVPNFTWYEFKPNILNQKGQSSTLFYKLFLENYTLTGKIIDLLNNHNQISYLVRYKFEYFFAQMVKGNKKINEEQTALEYVFDRSVYTTLDELKAINMMAQHYLTKFKQQEGETVENYQLMSKMINQFVDNSYNAFSILQTTQKLSEVTNFDELKTLTQYYIEGSSAITPNSLRETLAWLKPLFLSWDIFCEKKFNSENLNEDCRSEDYFCREITSKNNTQLLNQDYYYSLIYYCMLSKFEDGRHTFSTDHSKSYIIESLTSMINIEKFKTLFNKNHILNEQQKLDAILTEEKTSIKKIKL